MKKLFTVDIEKAVQTQPKYGYGKRMQAITVTRGGKTYQRQQQVGRKQVQPQPETYRHLVTGAEVEIPQHETVSPAELIQVARGGKGGFTAGLIGSLAQNADIVRTGMMGAELLRSVVKNKKLNKEDAADIFGKYTADVSSLATRMLSAGSKKLTGHTIGEDEQDLMASVGHKLLDMHFNKPQYRQTFWAKAMGLFLPKEKRVMKEAEAFQKWDKEQKYKAKGAVIDDFSNYVSKKALKTMLESKELASLYGGKTTLNRSARYVGMGKFGNLSDSDYRRYEQQTKALSALVGTISKKQFLGNINKPGFAGKFSNAIGNARLAHLYLNNLKFAGRETVGILNDVGIQVPKPLKFIASHPLAPIAGYKAGKAISAGVKGVKSGIKKIGSLGKKNV